MRKLAVALALMGASMGVVAATTPVAMAQQSGIAGEWRGGYISSDRSDVNQFELTFQQAGTALSGTATEVNIFADTSRALFLTSTLSGTVSGNTITFTKRYDGSGGVSHAVTYRGTLEANGRRVRGTYSAEGATGTFEMVR